MELVGVCEYDALHYLIWIKKCNERRLPAVVEVIC
jgi:hypothetical protein